VNTSIVLAVDCPNNSSALSSLLLDMYDVYCTQALPPLTDSYFDSSSSNLSVSTCSEPGHSQSFLSAADSSISSAANSRINNMTCFYLNARSTINKTVDLQALVYSLDYDIILELDHHRIVVELNNS